MHNNLIHVNQLAKVGGARPPLTDRTALTCGMSMTCDNHVSMRMGKGCRVHQFSPPQCEQAWRALPENLGEGSGWSLNRL